MSDSLRDEAWDETAGQRRGLTIDIEREVDGRWLAEVPELPGVLAYGSTEAAAVITAEAIALRVLADRLERSGENTLVSLTFTRTTS